MNILKNYKNITKYIIKYIMDFLLIVLINIGVFFNCFLYEKISNSDVYFIFEILTYIYYIYYICFVLSFLWNKWQ